MTTIKLQLLPSKLVGSYILLSSRCDKPSRRCFL